MDQRVSVGKARDSELDRHRALVRRAQRGDRGALETLFQEHYGRILGLARRRVRGSTAIPEEAEDLAQSTFLIAQRKIHQLTVRNESSVRSWLETILVNTCASLARYHFAGTRDRRRYLSLDALESVPGIDEVSERPSVEADPLDAVARDEHISACRRAVMELDRERRHIVWLRSFRALSWTAVAEIARTRSVTVAIRRYSSALDSLRHRLKLSEHSHLGAVGGRSGR